MNKKDASLDLSIFLKKDKSLDLTKHFGQVDGANKTTRKQSGGVKKNTKKSTSKKIYYLMTNWNIKENGIKKMQQMVKMLKIITKNITKNIKKN